MKRIIGLLFFVHSAFAAQHEYNVVIKGQQAGRAELEINTSDAGYHVDLTLYPNLLARMLGVENMKESSAGTLKQGHFYPKHYQRITLKGKQLFSVDFDKTKAIMVTDEGTKSVFIDMKGQDPLAQIAQIQYDLQHQGVGLTYHLITEKSQHRYSAKTIKNAEGYRVVLTQQPEANRIIRLWFDNHYELSRLQRKKRGKVQFDIKRNK